MNYVINHGLLLQRSLKTPYFAGQQTIYFVLSDFCHTLFIRIENFNRPFSIGVNFVLLLLPKDSFGIIPQVLPV
jgi:hypothetical protein